MQYIEGYSLDRLIEAVRRRSGDFAAPDDAAASQPDVSGDSEVTGFPIDAAIDVLLNKQESDVQESASRSIPGNSIAKELLSKRRAESVLTLPMRFAMRIIKGFCIATSNRQTSCWTVVVMCGSQTLDWRESMTTAG